MEKQQDSTVWYYCGGQAYANPILINVVNPATLVQPGINLYEPITVTPDPIESPQTFTVNTNLVNDGTTTFNGYYCAELFDASGTFIRYIGNIQSTGSNLVPLPAGDYYTNNLTFSDTSSSVIPSGTYTIGIYYEADGATTWTLAGENTYINPVTVTIISTSVNQLSADLIKIYPDPAQDHITIDAGDIRGDYKLAIYNTIGQQMYLSAGNFDGQKLTTDVSGFTAGIYTIQLKTESGTLNSVFVKR